MSDLPEWLRRRRQNEEMVRFNHDPSNRRTLTPNDDGSYDPPVQARRQNSDKNGETDG